MKSLKYLIIGLITFQSFSQEQDNLTFKYHSFSVTPLEILVDNLGYGGFGFRADVSFASGKNILQFDAMLGEEFVILGDGENYFQINAKYGRELRINNWLYADAFTGLGLFSFSEEGYSVKTLNIPVQLKMRFKVGKRFSIGLNLQSHFNFENTMYSGGMLLQWQSKNK